ncbi:MAG TPA: DUF58 domain-containing protein [Steroidobacteraceae bacterium]|nr:DUF58 domain-containing protein [Steroidobacteraceae bacterium]
MRRALERAFARWARRRQGEDHLPVRLKMRRLYVLPTRAGLVFGALVLGMLIAALNYANSLALLLTCLLGGLALVAMYSAHRNLLELEVLSAGTTPAFAGERAEIALTLANDSRLARFSLELEAAAAAAGFVDLAPHSSARIRIAVPAPRRGVLRVERLRLSTSHPFGLFRAWTWVHLPLALIVYPRPHGARTLPTIEGQADGRTRARAAEEDEWLGLRPFRDGDSPRQVAWKAYARGSPLLVKEYAASAAPERIFDFERLPGLDTEARLEQLARWVVDAAARGERFALLLPGFALEAHEGAVQRERALAALALHGLAPSERRGVTRAR